MREACSNVPGEERERVPPRPKHGEVVDVAVTINVDVRAGGAGFQAPDVAVVRAARIRAEAALAAGGERDEIRADVPTVACCLEPPALPPERSVGQSAVQFLGDVDPGGLVGCRVGCRGACAGGESEQDQDREDGHEHGVSVWGEQGSAFLLGAGPPSSGSGLLSFHPH